MTGGRFAPSPTGPLHVGNLRTALLAWGSARTHNAAFIVRFEDLDQHNASHTHAAQQLDDLLLMGITCDSVPVYQSERFDLYRDAISALTARGLTYECFCTRREIAEAVAAPHGAHALYPGTCRELTTRERAAKREARPGAVRLRANGVTCVFDDFVWGTQSGVVDDVVLQRNDGVPAYNVAVVVDDAAQGITEVVRGDDLLSITPTQVYLQQLLGVTTPRYGHVPLVVGPDGERLAKRHGAVTLADLAGVGVSGDEVRETLWASAGQHGDVVDWGAVPREPWMSPWSAA
jgi:glutamyl-tRNA synthetase